MEWYSKFIHDHTVLVVTLFLFLFFISFMFNFYLLGEFLNHRNKFARHRKWFHTTGVPAIKSDFRKIRKEQRDMFIAIWEYFYVILAVRGILDVDKKHFIENGLKELCKKYPEAENFMTVPDELNQEHTFDMWSDYYNARPRSGKVTEEIRH